MPLHDKLILKLTNKPIYFDWILYVNDPEVSTGWLTYPRVLGSPVTFFSAGGELFSYLV